MSEFVEAEWIRSCVEVGFACEGGGPARIREGGNTVESLSGRLTAMLLCCYV